MTSQRRAIVITLGMLVLGALASAVYDLQILNAFSSLRTPVLNQAMIVLARISRLYILLIVALLLIRKRALMRQWLIVYLLGSGLAFIGKQIIQRPRPFETGVIENLVPDNGFSFPSGHATVLFTALPILIAAFPRKRWLVIALFFLIIIARVYVGIHYPTDILAGALIGLLASLGSIAMLSRSSLFQEPSK